MSCPSVPNSDYFEESVINMDDLIMQKCGEFDNVIHDACV